MIVSTLKPTIVLYCEPLIIVEVNKYLSQTAPNYNKPLNRMTVLMETDPAVDVSSSSADILVYDDALNLVMTIPAASPALVDSQYKG